MGLFGGKNYDLYEIQKIGDCVYELLLSGNKAFSNLLDRNIAELLKKNPLFRNKHDKSDAIGIIDDNVNKQIEDYIKSFPGGNLTIEEKNKVIIDSYSVWVVGAYLNGQKLISNNNQMRMMEILTGKLVTSKERDYYNMCFKARLNSQGNKIYQAQEFLESIIYNNKYLDPSISENGQSKFASYFLPMAELYSGILGLKLELILGSSKANRSEKEIKNYINEVNDKFVDLESLLAL